MIEYQERFQVSERRSCKLMLLWRSSHRYVSVKQDDVPLRKRFRELAESRPRWSMRRLHCLLRREGWTVNHKRVEKLHREEGLQVRLERRRKLVSIARGPKAAVEKRHDCWAVDFVQDSLMGGRKFRAFAAIDVLSRECVGLEVAFDRKGTRVTDAMNKFIERAGAKPRALTLDNGTEFRSHRFDEWGYQRRIQLDCIRPGKPVENGFIESSKSRLRDELFTSLAEARYLLEQWRGEYKQGRMHSRLGYRSPAEFAAGCMASGSASLSLQAHTPRA